jgi:hypothetical protein
MTDKVDRSAYESIEILVSVSRDVDGRVLCTLVAEDGAKLRLRLDQTVARDLRDELEEIVD